MSDHFEAIGEDELNQIVEDDDPFVVCVRGHQTVEELLDLVLSESLHDPHALEIQQLGFALKVDLAVALGVVADRPVFLGLNKFRNRFAHRRTATLTVEDAADFFKAWSGHFRNLAARTEVKPDEDPLEVVREAVLVLAVLLSRQLATLRDNKAHATITHEMVQHLRRGESMNEVLKGKSVEDHIEERLGEVRAARHARGLL